MELAEAVQKDEAYADEAFQQCAPNDVAALLDAINMEYADPATLEYAGALQEALKVFREQTDAGRKTVRAAPRLPRSPSELRSCPVSIGR